MPDTKNDVNDINELLSGLGDELATDQEGQAQQPEVNPAPGNTPSVQEEPAQNPPQQAVETNETDQKIEDLLSGLDDTFGTGSTEQTEPADLTPPPPEPLPDLDIPEQSDTSLTDTSTEPEKETPSSVPEAPEDPDIKAPVPPEDPDIKTPVPPEDPSHDDGSADIDSALDNLDDQTPSQAEKPPSMDNPPEQAPLPPEGEPSEDGKVTDDDLAGLDLDNLDLGKETAEPVPPSAPEPPPETPAPESPVPETAVSETPAPETPAPESPVPETAVSEPQTSQEPAETPPPADQLQMTEKQLAFFQKRIDHFGPGLKNASRDVIINASLPAADINAFVKLMLSKRPAREIKNFLEQKTGKPIPGPLLDPSYQAKLRKKRGGSAHRKKKTKKKSKYFKEIVIPLMRVLLIGTVILGGLAYLVGIILLPTIRIHNGIKLIATDEAENIKSAENKFDKALTTRSRYFKAYLLYGIAYKNVNRLEPAEERLKKYSEMTGKEDFPFLIGMGDIMLKRKNYPGAINYYRSALEMDEGNFIAVDSLAQVEFLTGDLTQAENIYEDYLKNEPGHVHSHYRLLEIYIHRAERESLTLSSLYEKILNKYSQIQGMKRKNYVDPHITTKMGQFLINIAHHHSESEYISRERSQQRIFQRAQEILETVIQKHKDYAPAYYEMARLKIERYDLISARRLIEHALKQDEKNPDYYYLKGIIQYKRGLIRPMVEKQNQKKKEMGALECFRTVLKFRPDHLQANYYLAHITYYDLAQKGGQNPGGAYKYYSRVKDLLPTTPPEDRAQINLNEVNYNLGYLAYKRGDYQEALNHWADFRETQEINPNIQFAVGNSYFKIGRRDLARSRYTAAISILRNSAREKQTVEPGKKYDQQLYSQLSAAYNNLGLCWYFLGNDEKALMNLWQSVEAIKTTGYFNESEEANMNLQLILHPVKDTRTRVALIDDIPMHYEMADH